MNKYAIYNKATKESIGPCTALIRNFFVLSCELKYVEMLDIPSEVSIVDVNGAVLIANAILVSYKRTKKETEFEVMPEEEFMAKVKRIIR